MLLWKSPDPGYFMSHEKKFPYSLLPHGQLILSCESHNDSLAKTSKVGGLQQSTYPGLQEVAQSPSQNRAEEALFHRLYSKRIARALPRLLIIVAFWVIWPGLPLSLTYIPSSFLSFIRACHLVAGHTIRFFWVFLTITTIISRSIEEKNYLGN